MCVAARGCAGCAPLYAPPRCYTSLVRGAFTFTHSLTHSRQPLLQIIGPGLFQLPGLFQQSGWVPCMVVLTATAVWTTQCALYLSRTMASFAENRDFSKRLEMSRVAFELLPRWGYYLMVFTLCTTFYTQNLANIILSAQSMDLAMLDILKNWGKPACAFDYTTFKPVCIADVSDGTSDSIFGDAFVISPGYAIVLIVCIPLVRGCRVGCVGALAGL